MKKEDLYKQFTHYEALSKDSSTHAQRVEIYRLMENSGIQVPDETDERLKKGKFPFSCDFFISKHPTAHIIKWVPTRSADKKAKFIYKDPKYFLDILAGISPTVAGVAIDPNNTILAEQAKYVGAVLSKVESMKRASENTTLEMLMNDAALAGEIIDADAISIAFAPTPLEINEDDTLPF